MLSDIFCVFVRNGPKTRLVFLSCSGGIWAGGGGSRNNTTSIAAATTTTTTSRKRPPPSESGTGSSHNVAVAVDVAGAGNGGKAKKKPRVTGSGNQNGATAAAGSDTSARAKVRQVFFVFFGGGKEAYSFVACLSHLTIDHASLSRRNTVPSPPTINRDTSNVRRSVRFFFVF